MVALRNLRFDLLVSMGCLALLGYFAWHAWQGPRSYGYIAVLQHRQAELAGELDTVSQEEAALETKVAAMRPDGIDPDLLDELARQELNWAAPQDLILNNN